MRHEIAEPTSIPDGKQTKTLATIGGGSSRSFMSEMCQVDKITFFLVKMSIHRGSHLYISLNKKMRLFRYLPRYLSSIILFQCQHRLDEGQWRNVFLCRLKNLIFLCGFPYPTVYKSCIICILLLKMFLQGFVLLNFYCNRNAIIANIQ